MKKQNVILFVCLLIILVLIVVIFVFGLKKRQEMKDKDNLTTTSKFIITYSYGGGFGTIGTTATKEVSIDQDGNITFRAPKHEDVQAVNYKISKDDAKTLYSILVSRGFFDLKEDLSSDDVMDAGSSYITIKNDNTERKIGGYAAFTNKKYSRLTEEIVKVVGQDRIKGFNEIVIQTLEKSDC